MIKIHIITSFSKKIITNFANPYLISETFQTCFFSPFSSFNDKESKYYNKRITTHDNGNLQSHDQGENIMNCTINANSGGQTLTDDNNKNFIQ